jgi:hypothetical protein
LFKRYQKERAKQAGINCFLKQKNKAEVEKVGRKWRSPDKSEKQNQYLGSRVLFADEEMNDIKKIETFQL